jgi:CelD/BcsL family acetyltransferase involved in cellulose biosynthesis
MRMPSVRPDLAPRSGKEDLSPETKQCDLRFASVLDDASFFDLRGEWDELVRAMPRSSPYLLHAWLSAWWRHFGHGRRLCVQAAFRNDKLVGALPLCIRERAGVRSLEFIGAGESVLADVLLAEGEDPSTGVELAQRAAVSGQHVADFFGLPGGSRLAAALGDRRLRLVPRLEAPVLDLPNGWDAAYQEKTSSNRRSLHRRRRRQLAAIGRLELTVARTVPELQRALEQAFDLHARRWHGRPDSSRFGTPQGRAFERAGLRALAESDAPRIALLTLDDRPIAFTYYIALDGCMYAHRLGFDPAYAAYSPGVVNFLDAMALASEEGLTRVEFLGGAERFKVELADRFEPIYEGVGLAVGPIGLIALGTRLGSVRMRLRLKRSPLANWLHYRALGFPRRALAGVLGRDRRAGERAR